MNFIIILLAKYAIGISVLGIILYFFLSKDLNKKKFLITFIFTSALAFIFAKIFSHFIYDPRPFVVGHFKPLIAHAADNGFPSDHTLLAMAIAFSVFIHNKKWGIGLFVLGLLIGLSRVFAGVHHLTDIIGSIVIAGVAAFIIKYIYAKFNKNN
jgi:undecaprenyl-diphosphatase